MQSIKMDIMWPILGHMTAKNDMNMNPNIIESCQSYYILEYLILEYFIQHFRIFNFTNSLYLLITC